MHSHPSLPPFAPSSAIPLPSRPSVPADLSPISPLSYFDTASSVSLSSYSFRVFHSGTSIPALTIPAPEPVVRGPSPLNPSAPMCFVLHHGGGYSAASFGLVAKRLREMDPACAVVAWDCRGHGESKADVAEETVLTARIKEDLSLSRLSADTVELVETMGLHTCGRDLVFVGHSLGGAVVVDAVKQGRWTNVLGVVVVDVVEGSAKDSLRHMHTYIHSRPSRFFAVADAVRWSLTSSTIRTPEAARLTMPPLVVPAPPGDERAERGGPGLEWRTDLAATEEFWDGWFEDLSAKFLSVRAAKLLVLAGTDRLDTPLMIGQMQGKFQLTVIQDSGHLVCTP
ncbi:alpha/beta-hydrolase [Gonapodya prolifera JEL478]|uniref:Protein phosphatase methylesterase 1 n=1 Tax=Gonapodya prolifera (strain JEL478) TaxID=1344416 RepID=A0A139A3D8_GONPJ|nr:alpha/beta-hydrolase [Gonapodya prolifera JEL478]|eukprot:KXS11336.1 alpha/beta-hydrolase [Gonapodya prolifera JEL478]